MAKKAQSGVAAGTLTPVHPFDPRDLVSPAVSAESPTARGPHGLLATSAIVGGTLRGVALATGLSTAALTLTASGAASRLSRRPRYV